jgi:hypothetical protein
MNQSRIRMIFETDETLKRAIRLRAALNGVHPSAIINEGMRLFLSQEINEMVEQSHGDSSTLHRRGRGREGPNASKVQKGADGSRDSM